MVNAQVVVPVHVVKGQVAVPLPHTPCTVRLTYIHYAVVRRDMTRGQGRGGAGVGLGQAGVRRRTRRGNDTANHCEH